MTALRALYISHVEAVQNVVRFHKASSDANLEDITSLIASNGHSIEEVCCFSLSLFSFSGFDF